MRLSNLQALSSTKLRVSPLGLGSVPLGDFYGAVPDDVAFKTVERALKLGINYFDTAPFYGCGLAEHRLGTVLRRVPRDDFVISTKVGRYLVPAEPECIDRGWFKGGLNFAPVLDYSYDGVMRSLDQSLLRLSINRVDILFMHDVDRWVHGEAFEQRFKEAMDGAYVALQKLLGQGVIGAIGIGVQDTEAARRFAEAGDFGVFMFAGRYTLLEQDPLDVLFPLLARRGVRVVVGGPFNSGILATGARSAAKYNYKDAPPEILDRVRSIEAVCAAFQVPLPAAAIQFPLGHPVVASVVPGAASQAEVQQNAEYIAWPVPSQLWQTLKSERLIRDDAPVPV